MATKRRSKGTGRLFKRTAKGCWIARWYDHTFTRRERSTGTTDRATAERLLAKHLADSALRRDGVIDARADRYAIENQKPIGEHIDDWIKDLTAKGVTAKQIATVKVRTNRLIEASNVERLADLTGSRIQSALADLQMGENALSNQTVQHHSRAIRQFSRWLQTDGRLPDDPLVSLRKCKFGVDADRRRERRPLEADELRWLVRTTETAGTWRGLSGIDRAMLYRVATGTGFRASELRSLTPLSFRLQDDPPCVDLHAGSSKRRSEDVQPIRRDLAESLSPWMRNRKADKPLWPGRWNERAAMMLRRNLRLARARWIKASPDHSERRIRSESDFLAIENAKGHVVDFHALRGTFVTALIRGGATVKEAQELARHSDPKLTMNIYTKLGAHDLSDALDALPDLFDDEPQAERLRATGTYDESAETISDTPRPKPRLTARESVRLRTTQGSNRLESAQGVTLRKPLLQREKRLI